MFNFLQKKNTVDEKEIIEIKKKIAYMETDISILKNKYKQKDVEKRRKEWDKTRREVNNKKWMLGV